MEAYYKGNEAKTEKEIMNCCDIIWTRPQLKPFPIAAYSHDTDEFELGILSLAMEKVLTGIMTKSEPKHKKEKIWTECAQKYFTWPKTWSSISSVP